MEKKVDFPASRASLLEGTLQMTTHRDVAEDELLRCHVPQCIKKESRSTTTKGGSAYP